MPVVDDKNENQRDWRVSAILAVVWVTAIVVVVKQGTSIPTSMLVIASAFFFVLIPAMNDLVRSIERMIDKSKHSNQRDR